MPDGGGLQCGRRYMRDGRTSFNRRHLSSGSATQLPTAATPALATWASWVAVTPETPTEPIT